MRSQNLQMDYKAQRNDYDLIIHCTDLMTTPRLLKHKTMWLQEGMIDPLNWKSTVVRRLGIPLWWTTDTSLNGSSNACDVFCVASEGYKDYISDMGTDRSKILITGIPNFDNIVEFAENDFPQSGYVMVATTDMRETYRFENRPKFIRYAADIAAGRPMLFKLHPNENADRAEREIQKHAPQGTQVFKTGNTNHMIAKCDELITQFSTVVYVGIALGKKVHSYFDLKELHRLAPVQNGGTSATNIAKIARAFLEFDGKKEDFLGNYDYQPEILGLKMSQNGANTEGGHLKRKRVNV